MTAVPLVALPAAGLPGADSPVFINEFHYDNAGADTGEFVEIAGPAGTDLSRWSVVLYNGANGQAYSTRQLSGALTDQRGGYGTAVVDYPQDGIQNGSPDGIALVNGSTVVQFLSYEGTFAATNGVASGMTSTDVGVSQTSSEPVGSSLQLTGAGTAYGDFSWTKTSGTNTNGQPNEGQTFGGTGPAAPAINEVRNDQEGADDDEYFELAGAPGTSLDDLTYVVLGDGTGGSGVVENVTSLRGVTIGSSGFVVVAESTFTLGAADLTRPLNFENDDNVTHLLVRGFTGQNGQDLDTDDDGTLDVTPWDEVVDRVALVKSDNPPVGTEYHYGPPTVGPDGTSVPGHVFRCDGQWRIGGFVAGTDDTPGAVNACDDNPPPAQCGDPATFIHQIQGRGARFDPAFGGARSVEGVVTAVRPGLNGYYVQEEAADADGDAATSEGIFVFTGAGNQIPVAEGQTVRVTGTVGEFTSTTGAGSSQTQLTNSTALVCDLPPVTIEPVQVAFPVAAPGDLERYEGMLVELVDEMVISEYFNYDRFGEVVIAKPLDGQERLYTPTAVVDPGAAAQALAAEHARRIITLDDANGSQNPAVLPHPGNGEPFGPDNLFRGGDTVTGVQGVIDHTFGLYRVQPTGYGEYRAANPRPASAPAVGGSVRVASFNVLNYFLTLDRSGNRCGPERNQDCRGANTQAELDRQRTKIVAALAALDADVVGLMEMENSTGVEPAADLVAGLNEKLGAGTYAYVDTGVIGTDAIRVGYLYQPGTVRPVGDFAVLDSAVDPRFDDTRNRPMLTQTFDEIATDARFTVSVNHLKSKGSACTGDPDTGDGQGNCNVTRTRAAQAIADFLAGDPTRSGDPDHLVIGDLNSYDHEDPIDALVAAGYTDEVKRFGGEQAYGYVFDGQAGYLDHALANSSLDRQVTGASEWHINADEPDVLDYNLDFGRDPGYWAADAFRSSDHDPVLVGLDLAPAAAERCYADDSQTVVSYDVGRRVNGTPVPPGAADPSRALGTSDPDPDDPYYATLGVGGELVLQFARPVQNLTGPDLLVVDASDGAPGRADAAVVHGSWDGETWVELGRVSGTGEVDLGALTAVRYVKVVDDTAASGGRLLPATDGYDLDAVEVRSGCV